MSQKDETKRLHLTLPTKSLERLDTLVEETEATGYAEVLKNALRLYEAVIHETKNGNEIFVRHQDGVTKVYPVFG